jgi:SAM-dependent methyltransferase
MGWVESLRAEIFTLAPLVSESARNQMHERVQRCVESMGYYADEPEPNPISFVPGCFSQWAMNCSPRCRFVDECYLDKYDQIPTLHRRTLVNLGAAKDIRGRFINCDIHAGPGIDRVFDAGLSPWPFPDASVDYIYASHMLEHIEPKNLDTCMKEANRVLVKGGVFEIRVPFGPKGTSVNDEPRHLNEFYPTSLSTYCQGNKENTTLDCDWENPLFKQELCEVIRIFWQRERLGKLLGRWIEKRYTWPKLGIPVEIRWLLRKVA